MNPKFHAAVHQRDDVTYVKMGGVIDEDNELTDLTERIQPGTVVIDLGEIERINSCGVRDWVNWLTKVEKGGGRVVLVECSPAIVSQINLVNNFTGQGVVKSFFAPYFCPNCDREKVLLVEAAEIGAAPGSAVRAPTCRCDECDGVMEFDDMEDSYFAFLGTAKRVAEPAKIAAVVSELQHSGATDAERSKIRSRVGSAGVSAGGGLSVNASSLPSVPSLPSLARGSSAPASTGSFAVASAMSLPGVANPAAGRNLTGAGTGPGSRPGPFTPAGDSLARAPVEAAFGASVTAPKSSKMVYVLVAVLIAAILVLAILLFSGGGTQAPQRSRNLDVPPAPSAPAVK